MIYIKTFQSTVSCLIQTSIWSFKWRLYHLFRSLIVVEYQCQWLISPPKFKRKTHSLLARDRVKFSILFFFNLRFHTKTTYKEHSWILRVHTSIVRQLTYVCTHVSKICSTMCYILTLNQYLWSGFCHCLKKYFKIDIF